MQYKLNKLWQFLYSKLLSPRYLPYWVITLVILIGAFFVFRSLCKRKQGFTSAQAIAFAGTVAYYFLVFSYTVLTRPTNLYYPVELTPFWSYYDVIFEHSETQLLCIMINIAMLAPVGFLLPFWTKRLKVRWVILISAGLSYMIEFSQLILHRGDFELFDDPIDNIVGCLIGFLIGRFLVRKHRRSEPSFL